jgi:hypothetical protein
LPGIDYGCLEEECWVDHELDFALDSLPDLVPLFKGLLLLSSLGAFKLFLTPACWVWFAVTGLVS